MRNMKYSRKPKIQFSHANAIFPFGSMGPCKTSKHFSSFFVFPIASSALYRFTVEFRVQSVVTGTHIKAFHCCDCFTLDPTHSVETMKSICTRCAPLILIRIDEFMWNMIDGKSSMALFPLRTIDWCSYILTEFKWSFSPWKATIATCVIRIDDKNSLQLQHE